MNRLFFIFLWVCSAQTIAQGQKIDTVFVFDRLVAEAKKTQQLYRIPNDELRKNSTNLSEILRFQTPVYIKENGRGAVSSPSFRGTTAQQTSFIWNGVPINSIFLGQGDINNLSLLNYDNLEVKSGGGSVIYGSSAIGGTIHFNNQIAFNQGFKGNFFAEYGSYQTLNSTLKSAYSSDKFAAVFSAGLSQSKNDYEVPEKNYINLNGQYSNQTVNFSTAYRLDEKNVIYWHTQHFSGAQHYPVFEIQQTKTKYESSSLRSVISWQNKGIQYRNHLNSALIKENFSYFPNITNPKESGGSGTTYFMKNDFEYNFNSLININVVAHAQKEIAEGYQTGIGNPKRWTGSIATLAKFESDKLYLEAGLKKELIENSTAPFLYSLGGNYKFNSQLLLKFKGSKNFRYPSFNDFYWQPGGNVDLKPETSYQAEITPEFTHNNFKFSVTPYYNHISDMIRWLPTSSGYWSPQNTDEVQILGVETVLGLQKKLGKHQFKGNLGYSYTKSENVATGFQLSYVPVHKAFGMLQYNLNPIELFLQGIWNGQTFTTTNESTADDIEPYFVLNAALRAHFSKNYSVGIKVNNFTNTVYETTAYYPLPMRNYSINLSINF